jgi:16S rRNA (cytosine967-C5)-methyltransferase
MAFLKTLPSWEEALSLMKAELTTDSIITQLLIEHPTLDIQEFFSHPPLWVRLDLPESIADIDPLLIIKKATPPLKGILLKHTAPEINALFEKGILSYQDIAAQSIDEIAYLIQEPQTIIDCCAAPGGKATSLMSRWPRSSFLLTDVDSIRLNGLSDNITRFQKNVSYNVTLALHHWASSSLQNKTADFVLVDAPCSGTGVIRRHPDILWNKTVKDIKEAAITQRKILENAAIAVKSGGFLLYSTCSLSSIENDDTVHAFLKDNPSFDFKKITLSLGHNTKFGAQILPASLQDGLYYSLLQRVND